MTRVQLDDWTFDPTRGSLERRGESRALEPRQAAVLERLVEANGAVVSKDELLRDVWGEVAVVDHVVAKTMSGLRTALGESARRPRIIATVGRRGYRIVPAVEPLGAGTPARARREAGGAWRLAAAAVLGALAVIPMTSGSAPKQEPERYEIKTRVVVKQSPELEWDFAISTE